MSSAASTFKSTSASFNQTVYHHHHYTMKVTGGYPEPLDRQLMERIQISNFSGPTLMNRRNEMGGLRVDRMQYRRWGGDQ